MRPATPGSVDGAAGQWEEGQGWVSTQGVGTSEMWPHGPGWGRAAPQNLGADTGNKGVCLRNGDRMTPKVTGLWELCSGPSRRRPQPHTCPGDHEGGPQGDTVERPTGGRGQGSVGEGPGLEDVTLEPFPRVGPTITGPQKSQHRP